MHIHIKPSNRKIDKFNKMTVNVNICLKIQVDTAYWYTYAYCHYSDSDQLSARGNECNGGLDESTLVFAPSRALCPLKVFLWQAIGILLSTSPIARSSSDSFLNLDIWCPECRKAALDKTWWENVDKSEQIRCYAYSHI